MIPVNRTTESASTANEALVPPAETVRACTDRQRRLTEYIRGHTGEDIAVRLTPFVPTACVMPTSKETLVESDNADLSSEEAQQLADSVDADYLVLISTAPATVDRLPITDQLTADRAQQFGYALHELGHIRYTAIAASASKIEERVDEKYRDFVGGLWNSCEDAAIENQLTVDQSQLAADRLEIVSRSISTPADEFSLDQQVEFSFRDAIETALYDRGIYETGVCERLCDTDDDQFVFAADADRQAFAEIDDSIDGLLTTILTTPSSTDRVEVLLEWWKAEIKPLLSPSDQNESGSGRQGADGTQGESATSDGKSQDNAGQRGEPSTEQQREEVETSQTGDNGEENTPDSSSKVTEEGENENEHEDDKGSMIRPDPSAINTDQRQETPGTNALEYPDIGGEEDAEALQQLTEDAGGESEPSGETSEFDGNGTNSENGGSKSGSESEIESETESKSSSETKPSERDGKQEEKESGPEDTVNNLSPPTDSNGGAGEFTNGNSESDEGSPINNDSDEQEAKSEAENSEEHGGSSVSSVSAETNPWMDGDSSSQTSLGSFAQTEGQSEDSGNESPSRDDNDPAHDSEVTPPKDITPDSRDSPDGEPNQNGGDSVDGASSKDNDETDTDAPEIQSDSKPDESNQPDRSDAETAITGISNQKEKTISGEHGNESSTGSSHDRPDDPKSADENEGNHEAVPSDPSPAHNDSDLKTSDALDADREGAHEEAERSTPDEAQLERDFEDVANALDALNDGSGGASAAPESLDKLSIMPDTVDVATDQSTTRRWNNADANAGYVADTLRKALKESRRTGHRSGLTSGSFDRRRAAALARGEVTAFQVRQPGDEKQYDLVLILDRSGSMRTQINTAEDALVRFAIACEDVGINVGMIDFYDEEARLIKPFSVETQYVQPSLFSSKYGGGTPLTDALGIGCELLEQRRNNPLVIVVTDGKPGNPEAYQDELARSYAPVCGLTLALTSSRGNVPDKVAENEQFYDRHIYVHDSDQIANRLDQFAVMFDGL